jgi:hypothetical protein
MEITICNESIPEAAIAEGHQDLTEFATELSKLRDEQISPFACWHTWGKEHAQGEVSWYRIHKKRGRYSQPLTIWREWRE